MIALDCFTDYYPRAIKEANVAALRGRPRLPAGRAAIADADLRGAARRRHATSSTWRRRPACAGAGAATSASTPSSTSTRRRSCSKRASGRPIERVVYASSSSVYGDRWRCRCARTHGSQPVSPYGVTKLSAEQLCYLYFVNHGVPTVSLRYFTVYGPRQRPDMGFHRFFARPRGRPAAGPVRRRPADPRLHVRGRCRRRHRRGRRPGSPGPRLQYRGRVARDPPRRLRPARPRYRPAGGRRRSAAQKGDMRDTYADTTLARADLGFAPRSPWKRV